MTAQNMTLGDFVKQLIVLLHENNVTMLFKDEKPWHLLFYKLSEESRPGKPEFFSRLRFDWDGRYPKCPELSRFIHALHWTGAVAAINPSYDRIMLISDKMKSLWTDQGKDVPAATRKFLQYAATLAQDQFHPQAQTVSS